MHKVIFFSPMANNLSTRVKRAMVEDEICHREPEFTRLLRGVRTKIVDVVEGNDDFTAVIFTGSGTAALDAVLSSLPNKSRIVVVNNGAYGERLVRIAERYGLDLKELRFDGYPDLEEIESALKDDSVTHMALVHHETVVGLLNPLKEVGELCRKHNKILIVDAISSVAVQDINVVADNISFIIGSSNKGIGGAEGLSFVVAKKSGLERMKDAGRCFYLDLYSNYVKQEDGQTLFTPAVRIFSGLNEALDELFEEGVVNRIKRFTDISKILRNGIENLGFEILTDLEHASNTATLVSLGDMSYADLYGKLKERGFVIYSGLDDKTFRLCTFGDIHKKDIVKFLGILRDIR